MRPHRTNPTLAQAVEAFQGLKAEYAAAQPSRFRRRRTGLGGRGDAHYRSESQFLLVREYVRDMDRNDAVIGQLVSRAVTNQIQLGFTVDPDTGDPSLDADVRARFDEWASDPDLCDSAGEQTFWEKERSTLRSMLIDGDIFHIPLAEGTLQTIEADRCRTPFNTIRRVVHGVLIDDRDRRQEFWFTKNPMDPMARLQAVSDIDPYPVRDEDGNRAVFQVYDPKRTTQTRGVTAFAPIFDISGMFEDINFAALVKQQMAAAVAYFLERDINAQYQGDTQLGERSTIVQEDGSSATVEGVSPGLFIRGKPGEKLSMASPNIPGEQFFPHVKLLLTLIGINIGMPLMLVMLDGSDQNLSQWRGTFEQAKLGFRESQKVLATKFHSPIYRWKLRQWLATPTRQGGLGDVARRLGPRLFAHTWHTPTWGYIDPLKDAQSDDLRVKSGLASPRQISAENSRDYIDIVREGVADRAALIKEAVEQAAVLSADIGVAINYRDLMPAAMSAPPATAGTPAGKPAKGSGTPNAEPNADPNDPEDPNEDDEEAQDAQDE